MLHLAAALTATLLTPSSVLPSVLPMDQGFVDTGEVLIYYAAVGRGEPLVVLHGGPGASHDYFLPYLLPLARGNRLIFLDERGSGRSEKLDDARRYTVTAMADDVEAVRKALKLGSIHVLGHSYGGVLAQEYALKYPGSVRKLILCSTFHSTAAMNKVFEDMKKAMPAELRERIAKMEGEGLFGHGKDFQKGRYTDDYMTAAWGEGYFPYLYVRKPDPNFDPLASGGMSWDLYREMWGSHGEFVIDGNLASAEYADRLPSLKVPTLITVGDHDECAPSLSRTMQSLIPGSKLVVFPEAGHMTFVDQPVLFVSAVNGFLHPRGAVRAP
jgi:proline iminopeptidase